MKSTTTGATYLGCRATIFARNATYWFRLDSNRRKVAALRPSSQHQGSLPDARCACDTARTVLRRLSGHELFRRQTAPEMPHRAFVLRQCMVRPHVAKRDNSAAVGAAVCLRPRTWSVFRPHRPHRRSIDHHNSSSFGNATWIAGVPHCDGQNAALRLRRLADDRFGSWPCQNAGAGRTSRTSFYSGIMSSQAMASPLGNRGTGRTRSPSVDVVSEFYTDRVINRHAGGMEHTRICNCRILPFAPY